MSREIDHLEAAKDMLELADEMGDWTEEMNPRDKWAIEQFNLSAIGHALVAQVEAAQTDSEASA